MVEKITKSLSLTVPLHVLRSRDPRAILAAVLAAWLPLSTAVLVSIIEYLPAPPAAQANRLPGLIDASPGSNYVSQVIRDAMVEFKSSKNDPVVAYVSKMVSIPASELPENRRRTGSSLSGAEAQKMARQRRAEFARAAANVESQSTENGLSESLGNTDISGTDHNTSFEQEQTGESEQLIGFARLFSGNLSVGDSVYVLPPKFSPADPHALPEPQKVIVTGLYLMMGRALEKLTSVPAGVVFGIAGFEGHILKSGTLCSELEGGVNLAGVNMGSQPIVRVALEPLNPADLGKMIHGMRLLEQSDPCAQYEVLESGEHVISTAGELHLERCLKDLRERFARCEIQAGEPIVPFRETIVSAAEMALPNDKNLPRGTVIGTTTSKQITVRLRVMPIPRAVTEFLEKNARAVRRLYSERKSEEYRNDKSNEAETVSTNYDDYSPVTNTGLLTLLEFKDCLRKAFDNEKSQTDIWAGVVEKITAFGPRRTGANLLIDATERGICERL